MVRNTSCRVYTAQDATPFEKQIIKQVWDHGVVLSPLHQEEKREWEKKSERLEGELVPLQKKALPCKFVAKLGHLQLIERLSKKLDAAGIYYQIGVTKRRREHFEARHTFFQQMHFYLKEMTKPGAEIYNKNVLEMYHRRAGPGCANDSIRWRERQEVTPYWGDVLSDALIFRWRLPTGAPPADWLPICEYDSYFPGTYAISPEQGWRLCVLATRPQSPKAVYDIVTAMNLRGQIYFRSQCERFMVSEWCDPSVICPSEDIYTRLIRKVGEDMLGQGEPRFDGLDGTLQLAMEYKTKAQRILEASQSRIQTIIDQQDAEEAERKGQKKLVEDEECHANGVDE